jgi:putative FmdB family regulatory protein
MPLYEYRCRSCGEREERLEGFDAPTEHDCPKCGTAQAMAREISLTSFTLAGGGWYKGGYAHGSAEKKEEPAAPAKSEATTPSGGCSGGCACHPAEPAK